MTTPEFICILSRRLRLSNQDPLRLYDVKIILGFTITRKTNRSKKEYNLSHTIYVPLIYIFRILLYF